MKIVAINSVNIGSTGNIMLSVASLAREAGHEVLTFSAPGRSMRQGIPGHGFIGGRIGHNVHILFGNLTGYHGLLSVLATRRFCRTLDRIHPDLIHLHNLHNSYLNLPMFFRYIKLRRISVVWTLHDCWAFTGRCPYFTLLGCEKWKTGCQGCPYPKDQYPVSRRDVSGQMGQIKRKAFTGVENLTLVTPSQWLADLTRQSFLKEYPVQVIHNGIDLSVFRPVESDFRARYQIPPEKKIVLGVAFGWGIRKGLDVFVELAKRLDPSYQIVLVGTDDAIDRELPARILSIHQTQNQRELAEIYSAADIFVNPTREDNFPTVNMEALACGAPVITFNTGGSPEALDESCGSVVACDDTDSLVREIIRVCRDRPFSREACRTHAEEFDEKEIFREYIKLYESKKGDNV